MRCGTPEGNLLHMSTIFSQRSRPRLLILAGCLILMATLVYLTQDVLLVRITLPGHGYHLVYSHIASAGDKLHMRYIHSVERTPVQGEFSLASEGGFQAIRTMTTGTGTGLPNVVQEDNVHMQGKWMVVEENNASVPRIPFYYLPLNQLRITVNSSKADLHQVPAGSRLLITNTKMSLARALIHKLPF